MVMDGRRFATLVCEDLTTEFNCTTTSPEHDLLVECAGLQVTISITDRETTRKMDSQLWRYVALSFTACLICVM